MLVICQSANCLAAPAHVYYLSRSSGVGGEHLGLETRCGMWTPQLQRVTFSWTIRA